MRIGRIDNIPFKSVLIFKVFPKRQPEVLNETLVVVSCDTFEKTNHNPQEDKNGSETETE